MRRGLCFLTAAAFLLLLLPAPACACEHFGPDTEKSKLVCKGRVEPQVGVPGYTGDYYCPICDALVRKGTVMEAADDQSGSPIQPQEKPDTPSDPEKPAGQEDPEKPAEPEQPVRPKPTASSKPTAKPKKTAAPKPTAGPKATAKPKTTARPKTAGSRGKAAQTAGENGQDAGTEGRKWEPFSKQYPYRRVRMHPEEGIYAKAAGTLIWPVPASPFQRLFD